MPACAGMMTNTYNQLSDVTNELANNIYIAGKRFEQEKNV